MRRRAAGLIHGWVTRGDLQRLTKDELIELVLRLQRSDKTSRDSSKPPLTDPKPNAGQREYGKQRCPLFYDEVDRQ